MPEAHGADIVHYSMWLVICICRLVKSAFYFHPLPCAPAAAQRRAFRLTDEAFYRAVHRAEGPELDAGATALAVLVVGAALLVANAGDSRAVLSRRGRAIDLSRDHKPSCPTERERVRAAGARSWPPRWHPPAHISTYLCTGSPCLTLGFFCSSGANLSPGLVFGSA